MAKSDLLKKGFPKIVNVDKSRWWTSKNVGFFHKKCTLGKKC